MMMIAVLRPSLKSLNEPHLISNLPRAQQIQVARASLAIRRRRCWRDVPGRCNDLLELLAMLLDLGRI